MQETIGKAGLGARLLTPWCGWTSIRWAASDLLLRIRDHGIRRASIGMRVLVWSAVGLAALAPIALVVLVTGPYRPMVVNTDTMQPTLSPGDVIVNEVVSPSEVRVGDIVAYADEMRDGAVVTERVVEVTRVGNEYDFATGTDAGATVSRWTVDEQAQLGRVSHVAPDLGSWFAVPSGLAGAALLAGFALLFIWAAVRPGRSVL